MTTGTTGWSPGAADVAPECEAGALRAGAVVAFHPSLVAFSHLLWSETLFGFLILAGFDRLLAAERAEQRALREARQRQLAQPAPSSWKPVLETCKGSSVFESVSITSFLLFSIVK